MRLSALRSLYDRPGPWTSVYVDGSKNRDDVREELRLRLRPAPPPVREAVVEALRVDHTPGTHGFAALLDSAELVVAEPLPHPPPVPMVETGPMPRVVPMLEQRGEEVSWLRVVVDRTGGAIEAASAGRSPRIIEVEGHEDFPLHKPKAGGWSAPRYQRAAEVMWERNTGDVAGVVAKLADRYDAEVLIVAGDVRARQLLVEQLPKIWQERVVQTESRLRAAGADSHTIDGTTQVAVSAVAAARLQDTIDRYGVLSGHGAATAGLDGAVKALQRNMADTMLIASATLDGARLWIGPAADHVATTEGELKALGIEPVKQVRADEALVRAAAGTGAQLYFVDPAAVKLADGVGVLLRGSLGA
jgi:Bacterial archaeo-eukaryotic release factor family 2